MRVIIDADACPAIYHIIKVARKCDTQVLIVANETQNLARFDGTPNVVVKEVPNEREAADFTIAAHVRTGDIVITDDIGLAALVLAKDAVSLSSRGMPYSKTMIERDLFLRHLGQKLRRSGGRTKGPSRYSAEDRTRLTHALTELLCDEGNDF